ncbi:MAG: NapC/NirT family cytochrome c [Anaerolineae bacterium]|nr:NapC/NirT family cytochrome c [Anaerolineae bacterium]
MPSSSKRIIAAALLALALLLAALSGAFIHTADPSFCARCHKILPAYEGWQRSPHRQVNCHQCHADPGLIGELRARVKGLYMVYVHFSDSDEQALPTCEFDWHRCYECHYDPPADLTSLPPLPASHLHFSAEGLRQCAVCHDDVSHGSR